MNSLIKLIEQNIETYFLNFIDQVCDKYDIVDKQDLISLWKNLESSKATTKKTESKIVEAKPVSTILAKTEIPIRTKSGGCPYEYTKGDKKGKKCGVVAKNGSQYCSTHKKYEGKEVKESKFLPQPIKSDSSTTSAKRAELHSSLKVYYHKESNLVFKSPKDLTIVAKITNKEMESISSEEDIELCKKYGFKYVCDFDLEMVENKKEKKDDEEDELPKPLLRKVETKKKDNDDEDELPKPLLRKVETKKKDNDEEDEDEDEEENKHIKRILPIKKISQAEDNIKELNIKDFKASQSILNKALGCDEPDFSDSEY